MNVPALLIGVAIGLLLPPTVTAWRAWRARRREQMVADWASPERRWMEVARERDGEEWG